MMRQRSDDRVEIQTGRLKEVRVRDMAVRFLFGACVSAVAGVISKLAGPTAGGVFLAFPAILLASLTLVAEEEGLRTARDDARGAAFGAVGMIAFAVVCWALARHVNGWVTLGLATCAWLMVSLGAYGLQRVSGAWPMHKEGK